jgi:hypothetical protein
MREEVEPASRRSPEPLVNLEVLTSPWVPQDRRLTMNDVGVDLHE